MEKTNSILIEFDKFLETIFDKDEPEVRKSALRGFLSLALTTYRAQVLEEVKDFVKVNQEGTFTADDGSDCWYIDELVEGIETLKHPTN